jgi:CDP-diacylglycerol--serine O-phosphatidyltransferase
MLLWREKQLLQQCRKDSSGLETKYGLFTSHISHRKSMRFPRAVVPSLFTTLNMFCGFLSITYSVKGDFTNAAIFIFLGSLFDAFDGLMARLTKSASKFGVEFDSLSDIVTFGVAPSFMMYQMEFVSWGSLGLLISALPMICGGIRLARFNVQLSGFDKDYFNGLPIPAQAAILCSYVLTDMDTVLQPIGLGREQILAPLVMVVSLIMVSTIKYDTLPKFTSRDIQAHPVRFTFVLFAALAIIFTKGKALFPVFIFYLLFGIVRWSITCVKKWNSDELDDEEEEEAMAEPTHSNH